MRAFGQRYVVRKLWLYNFLSSLRQKMISTSELYGIHLVTEVLGRLVRRAFNQSSRAPILRRLK
jgi:hypothetical protein